MSHTVSRSTRPFEPIEDQRFRILSLDGGGIKGTFTASVLAAIEEMSGKNVAEHFDLIVGTSTGGIIALALGLGFPAKRVLDLYVNKGPNIFRATGVPGSRYRHYLRVKHNAKGLRKALREEFSHHHLGESKTRLVIPSFNAASGDIYLFKTAHHPRYKQDYSWRVRDVALATSAAPTYFPIFHHDDSGLRFVDGGVWANNPTVVGVNEAIGVLGCAPERIEVLSIGTTRTPFHVPVWKQRSGILRWGLDLSRLMMEAQARGMAALAQVLTKQGVELFRIDSTVEHDRFSLDDTREISELRGLGEEKARHYESRVTQRFLDEPAPAYEPYWCLPAATRPRSS